jgi:hypothetical protein
VPSGCRTWTETRDDAAGRRTVFISEQQGKMRLPDGGYRISSVQVYEFDPNLRAMLDVGVDEWNEQTKQRRKIGDDGNPYGKTVVMIALEYAKFGRQRAETGARLRVVKELTGMPTAFDSKEAAKPLVFSRVVQNTDYLLKTPEGRLLAAAQATGTQDVLRDLYGKQALPGAGGEPEMRDVTEGDGTAPERTGEALAGEAGNGDDDGFGGAVDQAPDELQELTLLLEQYLATYQDTLNVQAPQGANPFTLVTNELNNPNATIQTRQDMIVRVKKFLSSRGIRV